VIGRPTAILTLPCLLLTLGACDLPALLAPTSIECAGRKPVMSRGSDDEAPAHFSSVPISTDPMLYPYNHAASIVQLPDGDLMTVWGAGSRELGSDTRIVQSRRPFGETEWSAPQVIADQPGFADANPVLFVDDAGRLWLMYVEMFGETFCLGRTMFKTSDDSGRRWTERRPLLDAVCTMLRGRPIITADGLWVLPAYDQAVYQGQFWTSRDRGATWEAQPKLLTFPNNLQPAVAQLEDGSLFALMRNGSNTGEMVEGRADACASEWRVRVRDDLPNPNSGIDLICLRGGELVAIYNDDARIKSPLAAALSRDGGRTWSAPRSIAEGAPGLFYPSAFQDDAGDIHVAYSQRLEHIEHVRFNRAWLDGGS